MRVEGVNQSFLRSGIVPNGRRGSETPKWHDEMGDRYGSGGRTSPFILAVADVQLALSPVDVAEVHALDAQATILEETLQREFDAEERDLGPRN